MAPLKDPPPTPSLPKPAAAIGAAHLKRSRQAVKIQLVADVMVLFSFCFMVYLLSKNIEEPWRYGAVQTATTIGKLAIILGESHVIDMIDYGTYQSVERAYGFLTLVTVCRFYAVVIDFAIAIALMSPVVPIVFIIENLGIMVFLHMIYTWLCWAWASEIWADLDLYKRAFVAKVYASRMAQLEASKPEPEMPKQQFYDIV